MHCLGELGGFIDGGRAIWEEFSHDTFVVSSSIQHGAMAMNFYERFIDIPI